VVNDSLIQPLVEDEASGRYSRRQILQRAAAIGLSAPAVAAIFASAIPVVELPDGRLLAFDDANAVTGWQRFMPDELVDVIHVPFAWPKSIPV
jgi:hypothetical protein